MPPALRDLQAAFAAHLAGEEVRLLVDSVAGDSIPAEARLRVHRHHVRHSLAAALAATFPTVEALVGTDFFRAMAGAYVETSLPEQPVLAEYGATFPRFVAGWPAAAGLVYLSDVARLDWALNAAWNAPLEGRLSAADLAGMAADDLLSIRLALSPGTSLVTSAYPIDRIRAASQPGAPDTPVVLDGGVSLLVLRQDDDAALVTLASPEAALLAAVADGATLEGAALAGGAADRDFDLSSGFGRLLALGCFAALQH